jgi:hypothetical protein
MSDTLKALNELKNMEYPTMLDIEGNEFFKKTTYKKFREIVDYKYLPDLLEDYVGGNQKRTIELILTLKEFFDNIEFHREEILDDNLKAQRYINYISDFLFSLNGNKMKYNRIKRLIKQTGIEIKKEERYLSVLPPMILGAPGYPKIRKFNEYRSMYDKSNQIFQPGISAVTTTTTLIQTY